MEAAIADAEPSLAKPQTSVVGWIRYPSKPRFKFYDRLRPGDSIIRTMTSNGSKYVYPPAQMIKKRRWVSSQGTPYYLTLVEESKGAEALPWKKFLRLARQTGDGFSSDRAVTRPISDEVQALRLKRLWTSSGKLRQ